ncbi:DUF4430 domain-containing protein [Mycoplasmatota bacterium zrk1]
MKRVWLALLLSFALVGCTNGTEGEKCITVEVVYTDEDIDDDIEFCTDSEFLLGALEENKDELVLETKDFDFGTSVTGLKSYNFETLNLKYYWAIYVNGEYGLLGVSDQPVNDGDVFKFEATAW